MDDYYGADSYRLITDFLTKECSPSLMAMVGYTLNNTLSEYGTVNRGICEVDENNNLLEVIERTKIAEHNGGVFYNVGTEKVEGEVDRNSSVSMNYWDFTQVFLKKLKKVFIIL